MSQAWMEMFLNICFIINVMEHMLKSYIQHILGSSPKKYLLSTHLHMKLSQSLNSLQMSNICFNLCAV